MIQMINVNFNTRDLTRTAFFKFSATVFRAQECCRSSDHLTRDFRQHYGDKFILDSVGYYPRPHVQYK
jgi:hypothetical protein